MISGWKNSGKTESTNYLSNNYAMKPFALADELKNCVAEKYRLPRSMLDNARLKETWLPQLPALQDDSVFSKAVYDSVGSELGFSIDDEDENAYFTPRSLLIIEGNLMRAINPNHWSDIVIQKILADKEARTFVISDFRFKGEYERFVDSFGRDSVITVRVNRFQTVNTESPTERELDNFSFNHTISNTGDLENLYSQLDIIVNKEFGGRWL
jgi:hypothetical protein